MHLKSSPDTSLPAVGGESKKRALWKCLSLLFLYLASLPGRCHRTRHSWMNLPQEVTCPREPVLQDFPARGWEGGWLGGRPARQIPARSQQHFPGARLPPGAGSLERRARAGGPGRCHGMRGSGRGSAPAPGAGPGGAAAHGCGGSAAGGILTVTVGSSAGVVPASVPSLIQRAVATWARRSRFNNVRIKYLCGIVLESQVASREDASQEKAIEVNGREKHGWFRLSDNAR